MQMRFRCGDEIVVLHAEPDGDGWRIRLPDGCERRITARRLPGEILQIVERREPSALLADESQPLTERRLVHALFARTERGLEIAHEGQAFVFTPEAARRAATSPRGRASGALAAPMVGVVAEVLVQEGQKVEAYQPLVVLEAMKVMVTLESPFAGTVARLLVEKGQRVAHGATVVEVDPAEPTD